jgi:hypothetical protein
MSLKERLQVTLRPAPNEDDGNSWVMGWDVSSDHKRTKLGVPNMGDNNGVVFDTAKMTEPVFNQLPPGIDIDRIRGAHDQQMPLVVAGASDVSGVQAALEFQSTTSRGTAVHDMGMTDDQYHGEHVDLFYGTAYGTGGDPDGFVERNNYLDRL